MRVLTIFIVVYFRPCVLCEHVKDYTHNVPEYSLPYGPIIYKDMVEVMNEFDNSAKSGLDFSYFNDNESEDVDDLLLQYQHFLDIARNQRKNIVDTTKNILPVMRHDKYRNGKPDVKPNDGYHDNYYSNDVEYTQTPYVGWAPDLFYPIKNNFVNNFTRRDFTSCYCKDNKFPCKCGCKQCIVPFKSSPFKKLNTVDSLNLYDDQLYENHKPYEEDAPRDLIDDKVNININVKFPKTFQLLFYPLNPLMQDRRQEELLTREQFNGPLSYINKQIPDVLKKPHYYKHFFEPAKKFTIYKKTGDFKKMPKNHKNKKIVTIHDIYIDSPIEKKDTSANTSVSHKCNETMLNKNCKNHHINNTVHSLTNNSNVNIKPNSTKQTNAKNDTPTESIYVFFNISSNSDNVTEDSQKIGNSIEQFDKVTTELSNIRMKRELGENKTMINAKTVTHNDTLKTKNLNKLLTIDDELLYWPTSSHKSNRTLSKNITSLILERERKKTRLNITHDAILKNHTVALERAIFGDIDWNDMNAVVPVFISFVGKYIRGILTFCSDSMCHSMKCIQKECLHRVCLPEERFNLKGHCTGRNDTDSVAALESIMDLPSNIALEVVDILESKMLGKVFGKATLCITTKCVTFVASKKTFIKSKCTIKDLTSKGHCPNIQVV